MKKNNISKFNEFVNEQTSKSADWKGTYQNNGRLSTDLVEMTNAPINDDMAKHAATYQKINSLLKQASKLAYTTL